MQFKEREFDIEKIISNTIFLAKSLDDFSSFLKPGENYKIICSQGSQETASKFKDVFVHEMISKRRNYSTSDFFEFDLFDYPNLVQEIKDSPYIWTYQAYHWTNDLKFLNKRVFAVDYYLFLKLSNKFSQIEILGKSNNSSLNRHMVSRHKFMNTHYEMGAYTPASESLVVSKRYSSGGNGLAVVSNENNLVLNCVSRLEEFIPHSYSVNQIAVVFSDEAVCYPPSIQILNKDLKYLGSTFDCSEIDCDVLGHIRYITRLIGIDLAKLGYRGIFGCDFIITEKNEVIFIELNPRYQASTFVLNQNCTEKNLIISPHAMHIASFLTTKNNYLGARSTIEYKDFFNEQGDRNSFIKMDMLNLSPELSEHAEIFSMKESHMADKGAKPFTVLSSRDIIVSLSSDYLNHIDLN